MDRRESDINRLISEVLQEMDRDPSQVGGLRYAHPRSQPVGPKEQSRPPAAAPSAFDVPLDSTEFSDPIGHLPFPSDQPPSPPGDVTLPLAGDQAPEGSPQVAPPPPPLAAQSFFHIPAPQGPPPDALLSVQRPGTESDHSSRGGFHGGDNLQLPQESTVSGSGSLDVSLPLLPDEPRERALELPSRYSPASQPLALPSPAAQDPALPAREIPGAGGGGDSQGFPPLSEEPDESFDKELAAIGLAPIPDGSSQPGMSGPPGQEQWTSEIADRQSLVDSAWSIL